MFEFGGDTCCHELCIDSVSIHGIFSLALFTWIFDAAPELTVLFSASFTLLTRNHVYVPLGRIILAELDSAEFIYIREFLLQF